ncbi:hypothetical protein C1645_840818 [Glomus cerebriforme]|uniref:Uncharacterized protein n=1 Tax=Glomus cerebriforme TaxID=658196 RepID=A0A397S4X2_9GLOM|nr:hypothetical protein C1645_840818 [Glomus cerebriforme]
MYLSVFMIKDNYGRFRNIANNNLPGYYCISDQVEAIEASPTKAISMIELWTKSSNPTTEQETLSSLFKAGLLTSIPIHVPNATRTFWSYFNQIGRHIISESCKHIHINGYEALVLIKPIIYQKRFTVEMLDQFEQFFTNKETVNMSSYKTDTSTGQPILYLQDHKKAL